MTADEWFAKEEERLIRLQVFCKRMGLNPYESNEIICAAVNKSSLGPEYVDPDDAQKRFIITQTTNYKRDLSCPSFWRGYDYYSYKG